VGGTQNNDTSLTREKINLVDFSHLSKQKQVEIEDLLWKLKNVFNDKPGL